MTERATGAGKRTARRVPAARDEQPFSHTLGDEEQVPVFSQA